MHVIRRLWAQYFVSTYYLTFLTFDNVHATQQTVLSILLNLLKIIYEF